MGNSEAQLYATIVVACFTFLTACATITRAFFAYKQYHVDKERLDIKKREINHEY